MNIFTPLRLVALATGLALLAPLSAEAREIKIRRDRDGDGHYNTKTINVGRHGYDGRYRGYSNRSYYNRGYGYGGYGYGGYGYGGYGYPYRYGYGPSVAFSYYSSPYSTYYGSSRSYSTERYADDLAVDVQRALQRRGYYRGRVDGDIGPGTRAAIRQYQAEHRLRVTGRIDRDLVEELNLD